MREREKNSKKDGKKETGKDRESENDRERVQGKVKMHEEEQTNERVLKRGRCGLEG